MNKNLPKKSENSRKSSITSHVYVKNVGPCNFLCLFPCSLTYLMFPCSLRCFCLFPVFPLPNFPCSLVPPKLLGDPLACRTGGLAGTARYTSAHEREVRREKYPPVVTTLFMLFQPFAWRTVLLIGYFKPRDVRCEKKTAPCNAEYKWKNRYF